MLKSVALKFLIEFGICFVIALPFPEPDRGYGWLWVLVALYSVKLAAFLIRQLENWAYFFLFGKQAMAAQFLKSLSAFKMSHNTEYFDAESYLNSAGAPLVDYVRYLDSIPKGSKGIDSLEANLLAESIRMGIFSSEMTGALDANKILDPFGTAIMFKLALREAASQYYRPVSFRSLAD